MDFLTVEQRSQRMSLIRSKGTKPERLMASRLRKAGIRFRCHLKNLPGRPDFVLIDLRTVIFVDGEFWHGKDFQKWKHKLQPFWLKKIERNMARDIEVDSKIKTLGWNVVHVWGKDVVNLDLNALRPVPVDGG